MKKLVISIVAVAVILGAGLVVKKAVNYAGEPPIGGSPVLVGMIHPMGEPPIGG
jgi:hypothetical protein